MSHSQNSQCPFEHVHDPELEARQFSESDALMLRLLDKRYPVPDDKRQFLSPNYPDSIRVLRGVHPKSHGCVKAGFTVDPEIPEHLRVGLFFEPGKQYDAVVRFSNAAAVLGPDIDPAKGHGSRGMAIKVFNVGGDSLQDDNGASNQDFLMINQPTFAFANTPDYLRLNRILDAMNDDPGFFFAPLQLADKELPEAERKAIESYVEAENLGKEDIKRILESFKIVQSIQQTAVANPLEIPYFSAAPFLFGADRVMKFAAMPHGVPASSMPESAGVNYLRETLTETIKLDDAVRFDFMVQVRSEVSEEEIENASMLWSEREFPFVKVATVTIPCPQSDVDSTETLGECERMFFTPWHSLAEHRPIGSINRLRKSVYRASAEHRLQSERDKPMIERIMDWIVENLFS